MKSVVDASSADCKLD